MAFSDQVRSYDVLTLSSSTSFSCPRTPLSTSPQHPSELSESWIWTTSPSSIPTLHQLDQLREETDSAQNGGACYQIEQHNPNSWEKMREVTKEHSHRGEEVGPSKDDLLNAYQLQLANERAEEDNIRRNDYGLANSFDEESIPSNCREFVWEPVNLDHGRDFVVQPEDEVGQDMLGTPLDYQNLSSDAYPLMGRMNPNYYPSVNEVADVNRRTFTIVPSQTVAIPLTPLSTLRDPFQTSVKSEDAPKRSSLSDSPKSDILIEANSFQRQGYSPSLSSKASSIPTPRKSRLPSNRPNSNPRRTKKFGKTRMVKGTYGSYLCEVKEPTKKYQCSRHSDHGLPCKKSFQRQEHMKRHEATHDKIKPYVCPIEKKSGETCDIGFGRKDNWKQHIWKTHITPATNERNERVPYSELERLGIAHEFSSTKKRNRSKNKIGV